MIWASARNSSVISVAVPRKPRVPASMARTESLQVRMRWLRAVYSHSSGAEETLLAPPSSHWAIEIEPPWGWSSRCRGLPSHSVGLKPVTCSKRSDR
ncbi:hypothetical protein D3C71_1827750 [compost metagenome]